MAGLTHTIGGLDFTELSSAGSRLSLGCFQHSDIIDNKVFHPPGTDGNFLVRCGRTGGHIVATNRYVGVLATILAFYNSDRAAWNPKNSITIVDSNGDTILRCRMMSMEPLGKVEALGHDSLGKLDVVVTFTRDS